MSDLLSAVLLLVGGWFLFLAGVGITRMPDVFIRMQTSTKASTLGAGCTLLAVAVYFGDLGVTTRAVLVAVFIVFTAPVAAHMIGRAAYFVRVPLWDRTVVDELHDCYDHERHTLSSTPLGGGNAPPAPPES